jgi:hypothetical protein
MTQTLNTIKGAGGIIAKAAAKMLADELHFCKSIAKADEEDYKGKNGYAAGDTIYISKPARFVPQTTFDITSSTQDIKEEKVALTLDVLSTIGLNVSSLEFAYELELKNFINRVIKPAVSSIAQNVEQRMIQAASLATFNMVGTAGSTTFAPDDILSAREKMSKFLAPKDDNRFFLHDSTSGRKAVGERKGLFQSSSNVAEQYKKGYVGTADGYNWMESELLYVHTLGNDVTGCAVDDTVATGATTIHVDGITTGSGTVTAGSVFTIANVYAVHPITKQAYPYLQQFVVVTGGTASGTSDIDLVVSPAVYGPTSGSLQNVDALPVNDAAITFVGTASTAYTQNLAYHKDAFRMVSAPLIMPAKAEFAEQQTEDGITVAIIRDFDVKTRSMITRLDFLGGICADRPSWACRITS